MKVYVVVIHEDYKRSTVDRVFYSRKGAEMYTRNLPDYEDYFRVTIEKELV